MKAIGLITVFCLLFPLPAAAQSMPGGGYDPTSVDPIPWPSWLGTPGDFRRVVFGSFTGDCSPDAAALVGDVAVLLYQPDVHEALIEVGTGVLQIDAVKPPLAQDPWGLALAKADGIWLHQHGSTQVQIASGGAWSGLSILRSGNFDGAGFADLVGASGSSIHMLVHNGSAWSSSGSFTALGTVYATATGRWDADDEDEIGIVTSAGVEVRQPDGTLIDFFVGAAPGGLLAPVPPMDGYGGRFAWSFPTASGTYLFLLLPGGIRTSCGRFGVAPVALASAIYFEGTGRRVDLLTLASADLMARWFQHTASGTPYLPDAPSLWQPVGSSFPTGSCEPAFRDSSGDGVPDLLVGRPGDDEFTYVGGELKVFAKTPESPGGDAFLQPSLEKTSSSTNAYFSTHVDLPPAHGFGHVQIQVWRSANGSVLDPVGRNLTFSCAPGAFPSTVADMHIAFELLDEPSCALQRAYYFTARLVDLDTSTPPHVTRASASIDAGFASIQGLVDAMTSVGASTTPLPNGLNCGQSTGPHFTTPALWANAPAGTTLNPGSITQSPSLPSFN